MAVTTQHSRSDAAAAAEAFLRALGQRLGGKRSRSALAAAPGFIEIGLAIGAGLALLSLFYALFAPLPTPQQLPAGVAPVQAQGPAVISQNPFRSAAIEAAAPAAPAPAEYEETRLDLQLHGVFTLGGVSSAIISTPDQKQGQFRVGEDIWNGVTLQQVLSSEQVVILASGVRETLTLINRDPEKARAAATAPPEEQPPTAAQGSPGRLTPAAGGFILDDIARITPSASGAGLRLVVQPGPNRSAFDASGLRPGDVIVAIDNRRIGGDIVAEARRVAELKSRGSVALTVERDGVSVPVQLKLSRGAPGGGRIDD